MFASRVMATSVSFESAVEKPDSLRTHLLIELNLNETIAATNFLAVGTLLDKLILGTYIDPVIVECISRPSRGEFF